MAEKTRVTAFRLTNDVDERVKTIAGELSRRATVAVTSTAAMNKVIHAGLAAVETELGLTSKPSKKSA